jgi:hypothetical protein
MAEDFLRRWSRLKHENERAAEKPAEKPVENKEADAPPAPLPPVDKLTPESDFTGFMQPKVEDNLRRAALKKLFSDPHFNIPDPFEPYSRDWNIADPIPPEMLATLNQAKVLLFDKQHEPKKEQAEAQEKLEDKVEEKLEDKLEEKLEEKVDEPRRQDA